MPSKCAASRRKKPALGPGALVVVLSLAVGCMTSRHTPGEASRVPEPDESVDVLVSTSIHLMNDFELGLNPLRGDRMTPNRDRMTPNRHRMEYNRKVLEYARDRFSERLFQKFKTHAKAHATACTVWDDQFGTPEYGIDTKWKNLTTGYGQSHSNIILMRRFRPAVLDIRRNGTAVVVTELLTSYHGQNTNPYHGKTILSYSRRNEGWVLDNVRTERIYKGSTKASIKTLSAYLDERIKVMRGLVR